MTLHHFMIYTYIPATAEDMIPLNSGQNLIQFALKICVGQDSSTQDKGIKYYAHGAS